MALLMERVDSTVSAPRVVALDHQPAALLARLSVMVPDGVERQPIGVLDRPVLIEENDDEVVKGIAGEGVTDREEVGLAATDMTAGDAYSAAPRIS